MALAARARSLDQPTFRTEMATAAAEVEAGSSVELVVLFAARSGSYPEAGWLLGVVTLLAVFAALMFHDAEVGDYTLFLAPLAGFALGFVLPLLVPRLRTLLAPRAALSRNVELVARAAFQKAGLHATREATALLIYISLLERAVFLVPDRGVITAVPAAWLEQARQRLATALAGPQPAQELPAVTRGLAADLARFLPRRDDDMNELPEVIDVAF